MDGCRKRERERQEICMLTLMHAYTYLISLSPAAIIFPCRFEGSFWILEKAPWFFGPSLL